MIICYVGLAMVALLFLLCLRHGFYQWHKAEKLQRDGMQPNVDSNMAHHWRIVEEHCRTFAFFYFIGAACCALVEIIAGGVIWACGG